MRVFAVRGAWQLVPNPPCTFQSAGSPPGLDSSECRKFHHLTGALDRSRTGLTIDLAQEFLYRSLGLVLECFDL